MYLMYLPTNTLLFQTLKFPWLWITTPPLKSTTLLIWPSSLSVLPCVSQPRISLCTDHQRNRASAPTAQTCSLIEPTKSVPLLTVRSWSLRCLSEARVISPWSPALPTLQAVHALSSIFHVVFWVCALFQGCTAINCASRAFIQCLSSDLSPRYFSVQRTTTSTAVHSFCLSWFVPHVLSLRTFPVKSMRTTICASWRFVF